MRVLSSLTVVVAGWLCQHNAVLGDDVIRKTVASSHSSQKVKNRRLQFDPNNINEDQANYLEMQQSLTDGSIVDEWEWVLVRVNGVAGLENADWIGEADPVISAQAQGENLVEPPGIEFNGGKQLSKYVFEGLDNTDKAEW